MWITRFEPEPTPANRTRIAVKDAIDIGGTITTAGCVAVRDRATPATADAACLSGIRAASAAGTAVIVGKTTLTELCISPTGDNPAFGTPVNPLRPERVPGGSSSGSAVAVAAGQADIALGTDTGGSVRIPAACCGVVGLKTTWQRIPTKGVWPLAPSLDTVGPIARDVAGVVAGMRLLEPGWTIAPAPATRVGRLRVPGVDPAIEDAVDAALDAAGLTVHNVQLAGWSGAHDAFGTIVIAELWRAQRDLMDAEGLGAWANGGIYAGQRVTDDEYAAAMATRRAWRDEVAAAFDGVELLALPTLTAVPPPRDDFAAFPFTALTAPFNLATVPALALPLDRRGDASLQLVAPVNGEELLGATGLAIEAALALPR